MGNSVILAQALGEASTQSAEFFASGIGALISTILGVVAIIVVLLSLVKAFKEVIGGNIGKAVKNVVGSLFVAVFLFNPSLFGQVIDGFSSFVSLAVESLSQLLGGGTM